VNAAQPVDVALENDRDIHAVERLAELPASCLGSGERSSNPGRHWSRSGGPLARVNRLGHR
jgi:hypothetical protein